MNKLSSLFDEKSFYPAFTADLENSKSEVIIESPFITTERMTTLWPILLDLINKKVKVYVMTRNPAEHTFVYAQQSEVEIQKMEAVGIQVLLCIGNHHRKLAIIDRNIAWEGSLNILSQTKNRYNMA